MMLNPKLASNSICLLLWYSVFAIGFLTFSCFLQLRNVHCSLRGHNLTAQKRGSGDELGALRFSDYNYAERLSQGLVERSTRQKGSCDRGTEMTDRLLDPVVDGLERVE